MAGLDPEELIEEVPAKEAAIFVRQNTHYFLPKFKDIDLENNTGKFKVVEEDLKEILKVDIDGWKKEIATVGASYDEYDKKASKDSKEVNAAARRVPQALRQVLADVTAALAK